MSFFATSAALRQSILSTTRCSRALSLAGLSSPRASTAATYRSTLAGSRLIRLSSTQANKEFLCILPDKPGALELRKQVRPTHIEGIKPLVESGRMVVGGAMLNSHPTDSQGPSFKGSMIIYTGESVEDVRQIIKDDVYSTSGVWDLENVQIIPFVSAVRVAKP
ncbi:hypothetical protein P168DRAFT_253636 [Aspergillus campestris IBT 28561]|uniref:YCII-related domain-containing protein n=1 Tax=Aspergillus campestris (strain IBT 28561) TaxID=1392248 RepID=A0A2I1D3N5_ASPC2|nr:uncharacterized protein P168DRAFT_253636 [Aspergillus campestris IBT 28561]PKY04484.1 hypothetical protein P168DRAFT_253636 [Aspergillus campestris IBT 28561]